MQRKPAAKWRDLLYIQYTSPACYPPLEHSAELFLKNNYNVHFFGLRIDGDASRLDFPVVLKARSRLWRKRGPGLVQKLHYLCFLFYAVILTGLKHNAWTYASDSLITPLCFIVTLLRQGRFIYHEHDSPPSVDLDSSLSEKVLSGFRRFALRNAEIIIFPSELRLPTYGCSERTFVVWNVPLRREVMDRKRSNGESRPLELFYHGSIVPERLPLEIIEVLSMRKGKCRLHVAGYFTDGSRQYADRLKSAAKSLGVESQLELLGPIPERIDLLKTAAQYDVGLALVPIGGGDSNLRSLLGASNKPFDYMACGLALMVSDLPEWRAMYVAGGYGFSCNPSSPESICECIDRFSVDLVGTRAMGTLGQNKISADWNYEEKFGVVLDRLRAHDSLGSLVI